ncbi:MAG TPA: hypothetical protein VLF40_04765 [Candidatus Saccharimonadales bacterium]|nr:hypothetical protein [Candidatus Saccharimonadales bacterium]
MKALSYVYRCLVAAANVGLGVLFSFAISDQSTTHSAGFWETAGPNPRLFLVSILGLLGTIAVLLFCTIWWKYLRPYAKPGLIVITVAFAGIFLYGLAFK